MNTVESRIRLSLHSMLVMAKSKTSSIHRILFSFSFFSIPSSILSLFFFFTFSVLFHRGHAYQSGKRFTDSDWYSDNENSTSPFARILLKSPPQWTDPAFFPTGNQAITSFLFHPLPCFDVAAREKSPSSPFFWPNIIRVDFHYHPFVDPPFSIFHRVSWLDLTYVIFSIAVSKRSKRFIRIYRDIFIFKKVFYVETLRYTSLF